MKKIPYKELAVIMKENNIPKNAFEHSTCCAYFAARAWEGGYEMPYGYNGSIEEFKRIINETDIRSFFTETCMESE